MWNRNKFKSQRHQAGVTIIELMISIVLGLLLLSAATAMTVKSMVMNGDTLASAKLNQDMDSVLHVMVNDLRRAGYSGGIVPFANGEDLTVADANCVLYAYDANENGILNDSERLGFRLRNGAIQMRTTCTGITCPTVCNTGTWVALTDATLTTITDLTFDTENSKCISITALANKSAANNNNYWVTTTDAVTEFPCLAAASTNLTNYILDDATGNYATGTFVAAVTGDRLVETRQLNVYLEGGLTNDSSMLKRQTVAINVRNNHLYTIP